MALDIKPEKVKPYLKMITEAVVIDSANKGSLRKDIWDHLMKRYQKVVDYRDFLLAIRRFLIDGKMYNKEGYFSMHPEVIVEVRDKTPTPGFKKVDKPLVESAVFALPSAKPIKDGVRKIKQQRVNKESVRQSKIQKYFQRQQMEHFGYENFQKAQQEPSKGLGFQTPALELNKAAKESKDYIGKQKSEQKDTQARQKSEQKEQQSKQKSEAKKQLKELSKGFNQKINQQPLQRQNQMRKKDLLNKISKQSKNIIKQKKLNAFLNKKHTPQKHYQTSKKQLEEPIVEEKKKEPKVEEDKKKEVPSKKVEVAKEIKVSEVKVEKKKSQNVLSQKIRKALKKAVHLKNLGSRNEQNKEKLSHKVPKTKGIQKSQSDKSKKRKQKFVNLDDKPQIFRKRLRGKTLDLTQLGIIKQKKEVVVVDATEQREREQKKADKQKSKSQSREKHLPKKVKVQPLLKEKKHAISKKQKKQAKKEKTLKVERKNHKKSIKPKKNAVSLSKAIKRRLKLLKKQLNGSQLQVKDVDRKAKLDAVEALRKLFSKSRRELFIDGRLIYV